jgi:hypothetical protein
LGKVHEEMEKAFWRHDARRHSDGQATFRDDKITERTEVGVLVFRRASSM